MTALQPRRIMKAISNDRAMIAAKAGWTGAHASADSKRQE